MGFLYLLFLNPPPGCLRGASSWWQAKPAVRGRRRRKALRGECGSPRHPIVCPGGAVATWASAVRPARGPAAGAVGCGGSSRPQQMLGSGRAQSSQPCPPLLSGVPSEEQRGRGATRCCGGGAPRLAGAGSGEVREVRTPCIGYE